MFGRFDLAKWCKTEMVNRFSYLIHDSLRKMTDKELTEAEAALDEVQRLMSIEKTRRGSAVG